MFAQRTMQAVVLGVGLFAALGAGSVHVAQRETPDSPPRSAPETAASKDIYTCPMHPQIQWSRPDTCPLCEMKLVLKNEARADRARESSDHSGVPMNHRARPTHDHAGMAGAPGPAHDHAGMGAMHGGMHHGCPACAQMMHMMSMNGSHGMAAPHNHAVHRPAAGRFNAALGGYGGRSSGMGFGGGCCR